MLHLLSRVADSFLSFLIALPIVYVVFDFVENATILRLLSAYPDRLNSVASSLPFSTTIKRAASLLALALPLGLLGVRRARKSKDGVSEMAMGRLL